MAVDLSQAQTRSDPRDRHDDPLLDSLLSLCSLHQKSVSRAMLTAGMPLPEQRLSAELLPRAAARAGLQGRWLRRGLEKIPELAMPALLLLRDGRSALLLGWDEQGRARIMPSESEGGEVRVNAEVLAKDYSGQVFFAQPLHKFDFNRGELVLPLRVERQDAGAPYGLDLMLDYGVCKDICILRNDRLLLRSQDAPATENLLLLAKWRARVPQPAAQAVASDDIPF